MPGNFLPLLEESKTISQIDFYVFKFVCSRIKEWLDKGKTLVPISVNFSRSSLARRILWNGLIHYAVITVWTKSIWK